MWNTFRIDESPNLGVENPSLAEGSGVRLCRGLATHEPHRSHLACRARVLFGYVRGPGPQPGGGLLPGIGGGADRAGPLAGRIGDLPRRSPSVGRTRSLISPGPSGSRGPSKLCRPSSWSPATPPPSPGAIGTRPTECHARPGCGTGWLACSGRRRCMSRWCRRCRCVWMPRGGGLDPGIRGLGGGDAPVVPRRVSGRGCRSRR